MLAIGYSSIEALGMQGHSDPNRELLDAAALCRKLVPEGSVEAFLADHRQALFPDELFTDLFPSGRGRPSVPSDVIATVMVLQALEACPIATPLGPCATGAGRWRRVWPWTTPGPTTPS